MGCAVCRFIAGWLMNLLVVADVVVNFLLLGRPPETVSQRLARLRRDGGPRGAGIGRAACALLTRILGKSGTRDHCAWALDPDGHDGTELWRWSP